MELMQLNDKENFSNELGRISSIPKRFIVGSLTEFVGKKMYFCQYGRSTNRPPTERPGDISVLTLHPPKFCLLDSWPCLVPF
jgi:hypothetical protein